MAEKDRETFECHRVKWKDWLAERYNQRTWKNGYWIDCDWKSKHVEEDKDENLKEHASQTKKG